MKQMKKRGVFIAQILLMFLAIQAAANDLPVFLQELNLENEWSVRNPIFQLLPYDLTTTLLLGMLGVCRYYAPQKLRRWENVFAGICGLLWVLGYGFAATDGWYVLFGRTLCRICTVVMWLGFTLCLQTLLCWLKQGYRWLCRREIQLPGPLLRHPFLSTWCAIVLCYVPFLVIRYPAGVEFDAYYQIEQFLGFQPMTAHWPPFSSAVMGMWVWLGRAVFGSYDVGVFLLVIFQTLVSAAVLAYTVLVMRHLGVRRVWCVLSAVVYSVATIYSGYLTAVIKDALYAMSVVLFTALLAENLLLPCQLRKRAALGIVALLMCMLRNNGFYVLLPCTLALGGYAVCRRRGKFVSVLAAMAVACVLNIGYGQLLSALEIPSGSVAEALSVPFQQTARYVREYPDEVTAGEAEVIAAVLDYENLGALYDPNLSDPVKNTYHGTPSDLISYVGVWVRQFLRHPGVYVEATLNNTVGYYYPNTRNLVFYQGTVSQDVLEFSLPEGMADIRNALYNYVALFESMPVLMLIGSTGFYTWVLLYLVMYAVSKRDKRSLYLLLPSVLGIAICIAGPTFTVNGVRYALPVIYSTPLLAGLCLFRKNAETPEEELL